MILSSVEVQCDTCLDDIVVGAESIAEARRIARQLGARAYRVAHGGLCHECEQCQKCRKVGHIMEPQSTGFAQCKLCRMGRSTESGDAYYSRKDIGHTRELPTCTLTKEGDA